MNFTIFKTDSKSRARSGVIDNDHGKILTPVFMPVGTVGAVKTFSPKELADMNSEGPKGEDLHDKYSDS